MSVKYAPGVARADFIDELTSAWGSERPDLDLSAMATIGRLARLHAHLLRSVEASLAEHGLQVGEFDVLAALRRQGPPYAMTPTRLARTLMLSPAGMTGRLDRLEAAGLVERRASPGDRRSVTITLTDTGRARVDAAVTDHVATEARALAPLSAAERRTLDRLLRALLAPFEGGSG
jgi:DNA-binding MarR family transcriptional regulator